MQDWIILESNAIKKTESWWGQWLGGAHACMREWKRAWEGDTGKIIRFKSDWYTEQWNGLRHKEKNGKHKTCNGLGPYLSGATLRDWCTVRAPITTHLLMECILLSPVHWPSPLPIFWDAKGKRPVSQARYATIQGPGDILQLLSTETMSMSQDESTPEK